MDYRSSKLTRMQEQLDDLLNIIGGLCVAADMRDGRKLLMGEASSDSAADFYGSVFEVGRRFKIMSPDKMRGTYGKLVHVLMDAAQPDVRQLVGFSCVEPIHTVYGELLEASLLELLDDPELSVATHQIVGGDQARHAQHKAEATRRLCLKYAPLSNGRLAETDIERILHSLGDADAFLAFNRRPVERARELLREHISPKAVQAPEHSLAITIGREGARLSHSHSTQFAFVDQSLRLWNEIMSDFYRCDLLYNINIIFILIILLLIIFILYLLLQ
jgi:hypothetical protein